MNVFIYPTNSLILSDLVERFGHRPLTIMQEIGKKVRTQGLDSPPMNITPDDPKLGLKYAAVEVPSGVRGRMALFDPLMSETEAAIIVHDPVISFGCMGCARTNELVNFLIRAKKVPLLEVDYPENEEDAKEFVYKISEFLKSLDSKEGAKSDAEDES